jgi:hypothetical protein
MGKTYKRFSKGFLRKPRGRKQALIQGARKKAVPPRAWDDLPLGKQCWFPTELACRFCRKGMTREEAIRILRKRFRLSQREAFEATYFWEVKTREDYARQAFEGRPKPEQVAISLRYKTLVEWHKDYLDPSVDV